MFCTLEGDITSAFNFIIIYLYSALVENDDIVYIFTPKCNLVDPV